MGRDVRTESDEKSEYECFNCGHTVQATSQPGACPECGREMRNRGTPLE